MPIAYASIDQSSINSVRRYYLLERLSARQRQSATEMVWQAKQEQEPGTVLPEDFPMRAQMAPIGYTTYADLNGADEMELRVNCGLSPWQARAVLGALSESGNPDA